MARRKIKHLLIVGTLLYIALIYFYVFVFTREYVPQAGSAADPAGFLSLQERKLASEYGKIRNFLFLLELPLEVIVYFVLFFFGIAQNWLRRIETLTAKRGIQLFLFTLLLSTTSFLAFLPIRWFRYIYAKQYGISVQSLASWLKDRLLDFSLQTVLLFFVIVLLAILLEKSKRLWWFYTWCLSVPVAIGIVFIQPVIIDPLYHNFSPLEDAELERKILQLASESGIPAERVYEVEVANKTNAYNAYVNGIGANARIVLWDTTLKRLDEDEILFITAHEIGHYVEKHVYLGLAGYLSSGLFLLFFTDRLLRFAWRRRWIVPPGNLTTIVFILFSLSVLSHVIRPLELAVSRELEWRADRYAMELTEDPKAGIRTFQKMTRASLGEIQPPPLIKWLRYTHPTMAERITYLEGYRDGGSDTSSGER